MAKVEVYLSAGREAGATSALGATSHGGREFPARPLGPRAQWLERLADYLRGEDARRVLCIVPTDDAAEHLQRRLVEGFGVPGIFGRPVRTFYALARDIAERRRLSTRSLSKLQRAVLLERIAAQADLPTLKRVQHFPGFAVALGELIGELKMAMVHPADLSAAAKRLPRSESHVRARLADILALYERYQGILKQHHFHDGEGLMWHAVSALQEDVQDNVKPAEGALAPASLFFLYGFHSFHQVQMRFLRALTGRAEGMFIHLQHDPERAESFATSEGTVEELRGLPGCVIAAAPAAEDDSDLGHVIAHLFDANAAPRPSDGSVVVLESGSPVQEAEQVAREIRRMAADGGLCYSEMAVITRGDEARQCLAHLLARFEVPVRRQTQALAASGAGQTLLTCLRIAREGWPTAAVGAALKSAWLPGDAVERARAEVRAWELGVRAGPETWFAPWQEDETLAVREQALGPVRELEQGLRRARSAADMAQAVRKLLRHFEAPKEPGALRDDGQARRKIEQIIAEVERVADLAGPRPTWEALCGELERAIAGASGRAGAPSGDAVDLLDARDLGGQSYRAVFVVNLLENAPARENPFLRDRERRLLAVSGARSDGSRALSAPSMGRRAHAVRLALSTERQEEERLLFWTALSSACDKLYLSYPAADEKAKESLPSFYVAEVTRLFIPGTLDVRRRRFSDLTPPPEQAVSQRDWAACILHGLARQTAPDQQALSAAHYNAWRATPAEPALSLSKGGAPPGARLPQYLNPAPPYAAIIADQRLLAALAQRRRPYHPSELEQYLTCPYLYYCENLLDLHPVRRELAAADYGTLLHGVLARLYNEWRRQAGGPVEVTSRPREEVIARALAILDERLADEPRFANLPRPLRDIERGQVGALLARFLRADLEDTACRSLRPDRFELEFDGLDLGELDGRRVVICGRMDRVDLTPAGAAVVIDYKLGRGIPDLRDLEAGCLLQAPLYALALQRLFDVEVVGAEYVSLMSGKRRGMYRDERLGPRTAANLVLTQPEFAAKLESAAARARECVSMILRGELPRGPREECPTWCGYRGICRMDAWTLRALRAQRGED